MRTTAAIEPLEPRIAPASLTMGGKLLTYTDADGDLVKIRFTHAAMAESNFDFGVGGFLPGDTTTKQKLDVLDLKGRTGLNFTLTAKPQVISGRLTGDSHADIFYIDGTNTDLGTIKLDGDVASLTAGDGDFANGPGVKNLTVFSFGRGAASAGISHINGLGSLTVKTDIAPPAQLLIEGGAKSIFIRGSIIGMPDGSFGGISVNSGGVGTFKVGGSLYGSRGEGANNIVVFGGVRALSIRGSVIGDDIPNPGANTPQIYISSGVKSLSIGGDVVGRGSLYGGAITIGGDSSGTIKIGGSLVGGNQTDTGALYVQGDVKAISIGHDLVGGDSVGGATVAISGAVLVDGSLGSLSIGGNFMAGRVVDPGGSLLQSGMIGVLGSIGRAKIGGDILGDPGHLAYITAGAGTGIFPAIKSLTVKGSVTNASILAGYDRLFNEGVLAFGIGSVNIGGSLAGSFIIAGSTKGGDGIPGNSDDGAANHTTLIGSVKIGGAFLGLAGDPTRFYIFAPQIGKLRVGAASYTGAQLTPGVYFSSVGIAIAEAAG